MKVFFSSSTSQLEKYFPIYKLICDTITNSNNELTRDWLDEALKTVQKKTKVDFEEMYDDIISSILEADVGIVEGTIKGLSTGHQMTIALQKGKPLLYLHQFNGKDRFPFMAKGAESELLVEKVYANKKEIPKIVKNFLDSQRKGKRVRFNLVLTSLENNYLEWVSFSYHKTKTDIIRELIENQLNTDTNFQKSQNKK